MGKPSAPTPPDPTATIAAQSQANTQNLQQNAELNRIGQTGPGGSLSYSISGYNPDGTPQYQQNTQLNPQLQNIYDLSLQGGQGLLNTAIGMQGQVQNAYANPIDTSGQPGIASGVAPTGLTPQTGVAQPNLQTSLDTSGIPGVASSIQNPGVPVQLGAASQFGIQNGVDTSGIPGITGSINTSGIPGITSQVNGGQSWQDAVKQAQDAAYKGQTQYLDPQFAQSQEALDNQLANQGITRGSEAYQTAEDNLARQKQSAYANAQMGAVQAGNQEQNTLFGQGLSSANLQNAANAQGYGQAANNAAFQNQANQYGMGNLLNLAGLNNSAQNQSFGQSATNAGILNPLQQQLFGQNAQQAGMQNTANQLGYTNAINSGNFANTAAGQQFGMGQTNLQDLNAAQQQMYNQNLQSGQFQNQAQQQYLQNLFALRNQPLNEFSALMSGGQVSQPNLPYSTGVPQSTVAPVNSAGIINQAYGNQLQNYQNQMAGINNLFSLGGSLGGAAITGGLF